MGIFSDGFYGNTANLFQRSAAQNGAGATEEGGVPGIVTVLHQPIKERTLIRRTAKPPEIALKRIGRKEVMRRLQHRQPGIFDKPAHGHL